MQYIGLTALVVRDYDEAGPTSDRRRQRGTAAVGRADIRAAGRPDYSFELLVRLMKAATLSWSIFSEVSLA